MESEMQSLGIGFLETDAAGRMPGKTGRPPIDLHIQAFPKPTQAKLREMRSIIKGSVQFPPGEPLPAELIGRIVKHRVREKSPKK